MRKSAHVNTVSGELAHVAGGEFPDLSGDAILFHERLFGEVELQRVVRGERDVEAARQIFGQRISVVVEEQRIVGQR